MGYVFEVAHDRVIKVTQRGDNTSFYVNQFQVISFYSLDKYMARGKRKHFLDSFMF